MSRHSEGVQRLKNPSPFGRVRILRFAQDDMMRGLGG